MSTSKHEKVIILGTGPAGLTAALYTARATLNPLVIEGPQPGGQLTTTTEVENFPGFVHGVQGPDLIDTIRKQAERFGARFDSEWITSVDLSQRPFRLVGQNVTFTCDALIVATGATAKLLGIPGEEKLIGKGLSTCATCDGFFFRDKDIVVIGGGDSAMEEAMFLARFGRTVRLIHRRDTFRASKIMQDRLMSHPKVKVVLNSAIESFRTDPNGIINGAVLKDTVKGTTSTIDADGIFVAIGHQPNTAIFGTQLTTDANGYLVVKGDSSHTNVSGVFAAGDVHDSKYRQAITAAGSGCRAALDCERWLEEHHA